MSQFIIKMRKLSKIFSFYLFICVVKSERTCFQNIEVVELPRFLLNNSTSVRVSWDLLCDIGDYEENTDVVVTVKHLRYLSCEEGKRDYKEQHLEAGGNLVIIEGLHPYSSYSVSLMKRLDTGEYSEAITNVSTKDGVPQMRARASSLSYNHKDSDTQLHFNWGPPPASSQCEKYNSEPGSCSYQFKLIGLDKWNSKYITNGNVLISQTKLELDGLKPFSHYALFVYITNSKGEYNSDLFLKLEKQTKPSQPHSPTHLTVAKTTNSLHHISWTEPFPPTGEISGYSIRWRTNSTFGYLGSEDVKPTTVLCEEGKEENTKRPNGQVCYTFKGLHKPEGYFFSVQAFNKGVKNGSDWSVEIYSPTQDGAFELASSSTQAPFYTMASSGTLAVLLVLALIVMIAIVGALRTAYKIRNKLEFKQNIKHYFRESTQPPESIRSDTTMMTYMSQLSHAEIIPDAMDGRSNNRRALSATLSHRSQLDPLPPIPPPPTTTCLDDISGYLKPDFDRPERLWSGSEEDDPPAEVPVESYLSHPVI